LAPLSIRNCNPDEIDFPIPGNDDAIKSVTYHEDRADAVLSASVNIKTEEMEKTGKPDAARIAPLSSRGHRRYNYRRRRRSGSSSGSGRGCRDPALAQKITVLIEKGDR